jgi:hypothetical protein
MNMKVLNDRWMFDRKINKNENTIRFKACWVMKEYMQVKEIDYDLTYTAVINSSISRALLAVTAALNWPMHQYDVIIAFRLERPTRETRPDPDPVGSRVGLGRPVSFPGRPSLKMTRPTGFRVFCRVRADPVGWVPKARRACLLPRFRLGMFTYVIYTRQTRYIARYLHEY